MFGNISLNVKLDEGESWVVEVDATFTIDEKDVTDHEKSIGNGHSTPAPVLNGIGQTMTPASLFYMTQVSFTVSRILVLGHGMSASHGFSGIIPDLKCVKIIRDITLNIVYKRPFYRWTVIDKYMLNQLVYNAHFLPIASFHQVENEAVFDQNEKGEDKAHQQPKIQSLHIWCPNNYLLITLLS